MPRGRRAASSSFGGFGGARGSRRSGGGRLADIIARHINELVDAVKQEVRRNVADDVRAFLTGARLGALARGAKRAGRTLRRRIVGCIAPGCPNPSKGPRFHYLCDKHKNAPKKDYEAWRKLNKAKDKGARLKKAA